MYCFIISVLKKYNQFLRQKLPELTQKEFQEGTNSYTYLAHYQISTKGYSKLQCKIVEIPTKTVQ